MVYLLFYLEIDIQISILCHHYATRAGSTVLHLQIKNSHHSFIQSRIVIGTLINHTHYESHTSI